MAVRYLTNSLKVQQDLVNYDCLLLVGHKLTQLLRWNGRVDLVDLTKGLAKVR